MRKITLTTLLAAICFATFAQDTKVNVKKEKLYVNDNPVCIIDKKKKGMLSIPSFEVKTLDEKPLGFLQYNSVNAPVSGLLSWYKFTMEGMNDTVHLVTNDFRTFNKSTFLQYDEALGAMIVKYNLLKDNAPNKEGFDQLKKDFPTNYGADYAVVVEKEKYCSAHVNDAAKSDAAKPVTVTQASFSEVTKYTTVIVFDISQDGKKIGTIVAKGDPKGAKKEDSEYDYSPGILGLDGGSPLNYEVTNAEGCIIARYSGEERFLGTWKDRASTKSGDLKKYNKDGVKTRLDYMQAIGNFLVTKRYL